MPDGEDADDTLVKRTFMLPKRELDRFKLHHPSHGDLTWFLRAALRRFNDLNDVDPEELVDLAVNELRKTGT